MTVVSIRSDMHGISNDYGSLEVTGNMIMPISEGRLQGTLCFTDPDTMKTFIGWVLNNASNQDFNSTLFIKTKVLGFIPYSYERNYGLSEFSNILFGKGNWDCQSKQSYVTHDIKQQLMLVQARLSAAGPYSGDIIGENNTESK